MLAGSIFRMQIPFLTRHRSFFGDLETWNVWGAIAIVQTFRIILKARKK